mmetsp:Transcript_115430/g.337570  ORF Transcript_115430/g.337570 Transcript_115430/m.337570 type:complete len:444 (+) Transcript_115430:89-1420(+)
MVQAAVLGVDCTAGSPGAVRPAAPRNLRLLLCSELFLAVVGAFPLGALFDVYLLELGNGSNTFVGLLEGLRGGVKLGLALPLGALADCVPKRSMLRLNGIVGAFFAACCAAALAGNSKAILVVAIIAWGAHSQTHEGTSTSLAADYTAEGEQRTHAIAQLQAARFLGQAVAPAAQAALIPLYGANAWGQERLKHILLLGLLAELGVCLPYLRLRTLDSAELASLTAAESELVVAGAGAESPGSPGWREETRLGWRKGLLVPVLAEASQILVMFGSGVSVKFLPLFFKADFGFSPAEVCLMMAAMGFGTALYGMIIPRRLARLMGRARAAFVTHVASCAALYVFAALRDWRLALPLYVLRYAAMNSVTQMSAAIVMDCVDRSSRGRWGGIVSLKAGVWSGTAFLGGLLADATGDYRAAFLATAAAHTVAGLVLLPVLWLVPRRY